MSDIIYISPSIDKCHHGMSFGCQNKPKQFILRNIGYKNMRELSCYCSDHLPNLKYGIKITKCAANQLIESSKQYVNKTQSIIDKDKSWI